MATFLSLFSEASSFRVLGLRGLVRCTAQSPGYPRTLERLGARKYSDSSGNQGNDKRTKMSFEEYRKMKKSIKLRTRIAGLPMALAGTSLSSAVWVYMNPRMFEMTPEEIQPILGLDPLMIAAVCGLASGIAGYFVGGAIFTTTWRMVSGKKFRELEKMDDDFLQRLQKHRFSEVNKFEDDYYGDKIVNLSDYRQWIRKQQKRREDVETLNAAGKANEKT